MIARWWPIALLLLTIAGASSSIINKCCDSDSLLVKNDKEYACTNVEEIEGDFMPLRLARGDLTFAYNGMPSGCDIVAVEYASYDLLSEDGCIDKVIVEKWDNYTSTVAGETIMAVRCNEAAAGGGNVGPSLTRVAKCCPRGEVYDMKKHVCVEGFGDDDWLDDGELMDVRAPSLCKSPGVLYQYSNAEYEFELNGGRLTLTHRRRTLKFEGPLAFCMERSVEGLLVARACRSTCDDGPCVSKCCAEGEMMKSNNCSEPTKCRRAYSEFPLTFHDIADRKRPKEVAGGPGTIGIRYEATCSRFMLDPNDPGDVSYLDIDTGKLLVPMLPESLVASYCIENIDRSCNDPIEQGRFVCFPPVLEESDRVSNFQKFRIGLIISCICLALTLIVYILLPQLRNLHGKTLMCHVGCMLIAYICLARAQFGAVYPQVLCQVLGYVLIYTFLAAFSWLNVMCVDIWWTFGNVQVVQNVRWSKNLKKFLKYSAYAWGVPAILTTIVYLCDIYDVAPGWLDANVGVSQCWFTTSTYKAPWFILFIIPMGIMIGVNVVLFVLTAIYCNKVKSEIHRMQNNSGEKHKRRFLADKAKLIMNVKLFIVMGMLWVLEIISSVVTEPKIVWFIADTINVLQGIPIFCILVLKKKVYQLMRKRLGFDKIERRVKTERTTSTMLTNSSIGPNSRKSLSTSIVTTPTKSTIDPLLSKMH